MILCFIPGGLDSKLHIPDIFPLIYHHFLTLSHLRSKVNTKPALHNCNPQILFSSEQNCPNKSFCIPRVSNLTIQLMTPILKLNGETNYSEELECLVTCASSYGDVWCSLPFPTAQLSERLQTSPCSWWTLCLQKQ